MSIYTAVDIVQERVDKVNNHVSPIRDEYVEKYLRGVLIPLSQTDMMLSWMMLRKRFIQGTCSGEIDEEQDRS